MNVDGSEQRPLTPASDGTFESHAAWSPDGRSIVFGRSRDGSSTIEIFDVDLETVSRVAEGYHPTWPAEGRVAYSVTDGDLNDQLYVVDLQGEDTTHLSDGDHASWSPDARTVAISRDPDGRAVDQTGPYGYAKAGPGNAAIYLLNPDGSDVRALTAPPPEATDQGPEFRPIGARAASTAGSRTGTGGGTGSASGTDAAPQAAGRLDGPPADQQNDDPDDARSRTRDAELSKVADRAPTVQGVGVAGDPDDLASADRGSPGGWAAAVIAGGLLGGLALVGVLGRRRLRQ